MLSQPNRAYTLRDGEIHQEVDAVRLAIADRSIESEIEGPLLRRSAVWKFRSAHNGTHFFVTSSHLQGDMKGTVHPSEAHFGFSSPSPDFRTWVGPKPASRHLHRLRIRDLSEGEFQNIFVVHLPGFALMPKPLPFDPKKIVTWSDPHPPESEVMFSLTVVQGNWRQFSFQEEGQVPVGLLTGSEDRHALISFGLSRYPDKDAAIANMKRNLGLIQAPADHSFPEDLTAVLWMERGEEDPIRMIELHGVSAVRSDEASNSEVRTDGGA